MVFVDRFSYKDIMKKMCHSLILGVSITLFSFVSFAQVDHRADLQALGSRISSLQDGLETIEAHQKLHNYLISYGEYLLFEINAGRILNGEHLNQIKQGLSIYGASSLNLYRSLKNRSNDLEQLTLLTQLTESYFAIYKAYTDDSLLRKIIKDQQDFLLNNLSQFNDLKDILLSSDAIENLQDRLKNQSYSVEQKSFKEIIHASLAYKLIESNVDLKSYFKINGHFQDGLNSYISSLANGLSRAFGSLIGGIEWRSGYIYQDEQFKNDLLSKLRPLDILFEKKSFKLTDKTIPGNWGHTAVWLGTKEQLQELELWNEVELAPFREQIENGKSIFEMRKWGTQFDSLDNFLNLDEIAVTRVRDMESRKKAQILKVFALLAEQFDKGYDFGFDAMATTKITCTEIIMLSYGAINWPADKILGRFAITPNNMAEIAVWNHSPVEFISYHRAKDLHDIQSLPKDEFANVLDYRLKPETINQYQKINRICKNKRYRRQGAMRMKRICHDEFEDFDYQAASLF